MNHSYLDELNDVQRAAVEATDGPVLVVAGPGSGKTRVLTYRIAHLINKGVPPFQILALTFTNKAAREMKERIVKTVGGKGRNVWAGTFHSIFARVLRMEADKIGYPTNFTIYDTDDSKSLIGNIIKEMNLNKEHYNTNSIRSRISSAKSQLLTPKKYEADESLREEDRLAKRPYFFEIYKKYTARCKQAGAMDFDDLLYRFYELLHRNPSNVLEKYQARFSHVMVDEFQDTNQLQYAIVRKLVTFQDSPYNICAVGDDAQSIYAFRGATIQNILDYENDFKPHGIQIFKLEQNYRSTEHIVQAANEVIVNNRKQIPKKIWSHKGVGHKINIIEAQTDGEEGKRIIESILEQKTRQHLQNKEIAILYRTNAQSRIFEEHLTNERIPYRIYGGLSFYDRKEVKDLVAYMRLAVNPKDEEALRRVINFPKRGIGKTSIDKLSAEANQKGQSMWDTISQFQVSGKTKKSLVDFANMIAGFHQKLTNKDAYELAILIAKQSGILDLYKKDDSEEGKKRYENIEALMNGVKAFVEGETSIDTDTVSDKTLASYIQNIALMTSLDDDNTNDDRVNLMSVHAAKGLEFKSVFVAGLEEKLFPSFMSLDSIEGENEERRLFYVAITRAEHLLTLSYAKRRYRYGKVQFTDPSRFLTEIPGSHLLSLKKIQSFEGQRGSMERVTNARVMGNFKRTNTNSAAKPAVDPATFKPAPSSSIQSGMEVIHLKFGKGKVLRIDSGSNRIATIHFEGIDEEKKIMLKFAKLQIVK